MGQSQLMMIVMAVVIIGIAVAVGINQLGSSALQANKNGLISDCASVISKAQMWYRTPTSLGGGGNAYTGATLAKIGAPSSNSNGTYTLNVPSATTVQCVGKGTEKTSDGDTLTVTMTYYANGDSMTTSTNE